MSKPPNNKTPNQPIYSAVQLNFTPEIEVFDMLSERSETVPKECVSAEKSLPKLTPTLFLLEYRAPE